MKALTIHQPWASLIANGKKSIETRSWATRYRGLVAIHASKNKSNFYLCNHSNFRQALPKNNNLIKLPLGAVIAVAELVNCIEITPDNLPPEPEYSFGHYGYGRYMWVFENVRALAKPIPANGLQKLWNWMVPPGVQL